MNIIDVANHSVDGIKFRRTEWVNKKNFIVKNGDHFYKHYPLDQERAVVLSIDDLLADDWVSEEELTPMRREYLNAIDHNITFTNPEEERVSVIFWEAAWNAAERHFTNKDNQH